MNHGKYIGCVIAESLADQCMINGFEVFKIHISSEPDDRWHICTGSRFESDLILIQNNFLDGGWYAHFANSVSDEGVVVFKEKMFRMKKSDSSTWTGAIEYGRSIGIPEEQLDFEFESLKG